MTANKRHFSRSKKNLQLIKPDFISFGLVLTLSILGVLMVFNASNVDAYYQFGDKFHLFKLQLIWLIIGLAALVVTTFLPLVKLKTISLLFFISTLILLVAVLIPGFSREIQGARRWLYLGNFSLQPSELIKLALVVYLPAFLIKHTKLMPFLLLILTISALLLLEPDLGTTIIVIGTAFCCFFLAGAPIKRIFILTVSLICLSILAIMASPYRMDRLKTFFNPNLDPSGTSYHVRQVLISLGSGGLTGTGIGRSMQKYQYLPEASTDSIFALTAEEIGFIGALVILGLYLYLFLRCLGQLKLITEPYYRLVGSAVICWLAIQTLVNLGSMVIIIPLTGVPLPFISYGGSSLVTVLSGFGLYLNASRFRS